MTHLARIERESLCDTFVEVGPDAPIRTTDNGSPVTSTTLRPFLNTMSADSGAVRGRRVSSCAAASVTSLSTTDRSPPSSTACTV